MDSDDVRALTDYLTKGVYPLGLNRDDKRSLRQKATCFLFHEGRLYHRGKEGRRQLVICNSDEKQQIIHLMHTDPGSRGGHNGMNTTIRKISEQFWWRRLVDDVRTFCKSCNVCSNLTSAKQKNTYSLPTEWPEDLMSCSDPTPAAVPTVDMQSASYASDLLQMLQMLYEQKICCDVVVSAGRFQMHAHKVVLIASSGYFKSMLLDKDLPFNDVITLSNISGACLELLISFLYSGILRLNRENVQQMLEAAVSLDISSAVDLCKKFLHQECDEGQHQVDAIADLTSSEMRMIDQKSGLKNYEELADLELFIETEKMAIIKEEVDATTSEKRIKVKNEDVFSDDHNMPKTLEANSDASCSLPISRKHKQIDLPSGTLVDESPRKRSRGRPRKSLDTAVGQKSECHYATRSSTGAAVAKRKSRDYEDISSSSRSHLSRSSENKTKSEAFKNQKNNSSDSLAVAQPNVSFTNAECFRCDFCSAEFRVRTRLKLHYAQTHCSIMVQDVVFWLSRHLVAKAIDCQFPHIQQICVDSNTNDLNYRCQNCGSIFKSKYDALSHHLVNHSPVWCLSRRFRHFSSRLRFLRQRHFKHLASVGDQKNLSDSMKESNNLSTARLSSVDSTNGDVFSISNKCGWCGQTFSSRSQLRQHRQTVHRRPKMPEPSGIKRRVQRDWNCREKGCGQLFKTKDKLKVHMSEVHPSVMFSCPDCRFKTQVEQILLRHLIRRHRERHMCQLCGKAYHKPFLLRVHLFNRHKLSDPQLKLYHCEHEGCDYACPSKNGLNLHILKHTSGSPFACSHCSKTFKRSVGLEKHISKIHLGIRPYICDKCGVSYGDESELKIHMTRHAENKPYSCTYCDYSTFQKGSLKSHLFCRHQVLMDHEMSVMKCDQCNFTTDKKCRFHDHVKMHHNIRDIPCGECGKMFVTKKTLRQHIIKVHRQKQVACSYCSYTTSTQSKLNEHLSQNHSYQDAGVLFVEPSQHHLQQQQQLSDQQQQQVHLQPQPCINGLIPVSEYQALMPLENAPQFSIPTDASIMVGIPMPLDANAYCFQTIDRSHMVL